jgi:hypothetical protein
MRCLIGFFGLTRCVQQTVPAIKAGFYDPLHKAKLVTARAAHFNLPARIDNPRSGEFGVTPQRDASSALELDLCWNEPQHDQTICEQMKIARRYPDPFRDGYRSVSNVCHQLRSLAKLWSLLTLLDARDDDLVLLLRPDLLYLDVLDVDIHLGPLLEGRRDIVVPGWQSWGGLNDRFAFCTGRAARVYATRIVMLREACAAIGAMHSECLLKFAMKQHGLRVGQTDFRAVRIRGNGQIAGNDAGMMQAFMASMTA